MSCIVGGTVFFVLGVYEVFYIPDGLDYWGKWTFPGSIMGVLGASYFFIDAIRSLKNSVDKARRFYLIRRIILLLSIIIISITLIVASRPWNLMMQ